MKKVFLDTSFILAYVNSNDELHKNALRLEEAENVLSPDCYINNNVLNEVLTLTGRKINIDAAEEICADLTAADLEGLVVLSGGFTADGRAGLCLASLERECDLAGRQCFHLYRFLLWRFVLYSKDQRNSA